MEYMITLNNVQVIVNSDDADAAEWEAKRRASEIAMDFQVERVEVY